MEELTLKQACNLDIKVDANCETVLGKGAFLFRKLVTSPDLPVLLLLAVVMVIALFTIAICIILLRAKKRKRK